MHQGLRAVLATGAELFRPRLLAWLAEAYGQEGQVEEGLDMLAEALTAADESGYNSHTAEMYRLKGDLLLTRESKRQRAKGKAILEAEESFQTALSIAPRKRAKSLELLAANSLARLWQQQENIQQAYE